MDCILSNSAANVSPITESEKRLNILYIHVVNNVCMYVCISVYFLEYRSTSDLAIIPFFETSSWFSYTWRKRFRRWVRSGCAHLYPEQPLKKCMYYVWMYVCMYIYVYLNEWSSKRVCMYVHDVCMYDVCTVCAATSNAMQLTLHRSALQSSMDIHFPGSGTQSVHSNRLR